MKRFFDNANNQLVYVGKAANDVYWNQHWNTENSNLEELIRKNNRFIVNQTKKYLPPGAKILEGGCGLGNNVYALCYHGYNACGIDYAKETIEKIHRYVPELEIQLGDVRSLPYQDSVFDGYWSLGVIEHFYDGFISVVQEAWRVLKNDGYFFVTCPYMSLIRKLKAYLRYYPYWNAAQQDLGKFYQFALDKKSVVNKINSNGFRLCAMQPFDGVKGFKDEVTWSRKWLQSVYDGRGVGMRIVRKFLDLSLRRFAAHSILLVFQKSKPEDV